MAGNNASIVKDFLKELGTGSLDKAVAYLAEDAMWAIVQTSRGVSISKPDLQVRLAGMRAAFKDHGMQLTPINIIEGGEFLAVELESYAVTILDKVYANKYCIIFKMADGKIADVKEYNDSIHVTEVLLPAVAHAMAQQAR